MARAELKSLQDSLSTLAQDKEALQFELRTRPRVRLLQAPERSGPPAAPAAADPEKP
jgi:hypothetical protein